VEDDCAARTAGAWLAERAVVSAVERPPPCPSGLAAGAG
jgi:hypothetical protein